MRAILFLLLLLCSCSPSSLEDFQREGESICRLLTRDLKKIETREQLLKAAPQLKARFEALTDLMIEARLFQQKSDESPDLMGTETAASAALLHELKRIYRIEAGREIIEKAQKEALFRLDTFEQKRKRALLH